MNIIGLVGPFGSGCSYVADIICNKHNYKKLSLSDKLKSLFVTQKPGQNSSRSALQDFGNKIRETHGNSYLSELIWEDVKNTDDNYVIDSIRNPNEVDFFRKNCPSFYLFGVFAEPQIRWSRVKGKYEDDQRKFEADDKRDSGESFEHGQRVTDTFRSADIIILNNHKIVPGNKAEKDFFYLIEEKLDIINRRIPFLPTPRETYMAMAYAASLRSSCLKRKVGATIVDSMGNVFSSGYNEVPLTQDTCQAEYGKCYRDSLKNNFRVTLEKIIENTAMLEKTYNEFKKQFKILDYCRALHAEENAIINVARVGASATLSTAILYTTTYPCNLCANKIIQVGIKKIVYFEPYPMKEAKKILEDMGVVQEPFQGVTYNAYFKLMEVVY